MRVKRKTKGTRPPSREDVLMAQEDRRCNRLFKIAMHGIASFYGDNADVALSLLKKLVAKSDKIAARAEIMERSAFELRTFRIRQDKILKGSKDVRLRQQPIKLLERALFDPPSSNVRARTAGSARMDRQYYGRGRS